MELIALFILVGILWTAARMWVYRAEATRPEPPRDPANPYSPPAAPLVEEPDASALEALGSPVDPALSRRFKSSLEGPGEALPLGNQPGWNFGPPPPPAELEPPDDAHHVTLSEDELKRLKPDESQPG